MTHTKQSEKNKKVLRRIVGEDPSLADAAQLLLYRDSDLHKLDVLASVLNDVPPDSPEHWLAELIERLVTTPQTEQKWEKQASPIIGPTCYTPAPGSPLYELNMFLGTNPCFLRIEGLGRADGKVTVHATHIPIPLPRLMQEKLGISDSVIEKSAKETVVVDRILWILWEIFYRDIDLTRLKTCSICHKWFVDHSKNKSRIRCSNPKCTSKRWSWEARKEAGHDLTGNERNTRRNRAKAKKA